MASGWNLWVWLPCIGVVSGCCCKEVYNYIDILTIIIIFHYSTCISSFLAAISLLLCSFLMFFRACFCYFFTIIGERREPHTYRTAAFFIYNIYIYDRASCITRYAQTSDWPVEVQRSI